MIILWQINSLKKITKQIRLYPKYNRKNIKRVFTKKFTLLFERNLICVDDFDIRQYQMITINYLSKNIQKMNVKLNTFCILFLDNYFLNISL